MHLLVRTGGVCLGLLLATAVAPAWSDVGRTPGNASVTTTGNATYGIPLWTPPGAGGMNPSLALVYSHDASNGLLGVGWTIEGLPAITRCNKTTSQDGVMSAPTLVATDAYCIGGNKLRLETGSAGTDGAVYRTEIETFSKFTARSSAGGGPGRWEVRTKDGLIYEYGHSTSSQILTVGSSSARLWAVSTIRDRAGNTIEFTYVNDTSNGSYRPDEIRYASNVNAGLATAPYVVKFHYETRPDPIRGFAFGSATVSGKIDELYRVDRIEVKHEGSNVRIYDLTYSMGTSGLSRLASIIECSTSMSNCLSPTSFSYTNNASGYQGETTVAGKFGFLSDINGDGRDDTAYFAGTWRVRFSDGTTLGPEIDTGITYATNSQYLIDWDGDGVKDLLQGQIGSNQDWQVLRSSASGLTHVASVARPYGSNPGLGAADVNGDGRDDLLSTWVGEWEIGMPMNRGIITVRHGIGSGFSSPTNIAGLPNYRNAANHPFWATRGTATYPRMVDFNGDGRSDNVYLYQRTNLPATLDGPTYAHPILSGSGVGGGILLPEYDAGGPIWFGDFNADGLSDIASVVWNANRSDSFLVVHFSNGGSFLAPVGGPSRLGFGTHVTQAAVSDYDGDGRDDLLSWKGSTGTLHVFRSTGNGFADPIDTGIVVPSSGFRVGDTNGDGLLDLWYVSGGQSKVRLHNTAPNDLLTSVADGFGVTSTFTYAPLSDSSVYQKILGSTFPIVDVQTTRSVVKKLTVTDGSGTGASFDTEYYYRGAKVDTHGRGHLGFATREVTDRSAGYNIKTIETYRQDFPYVGALASIEQRQSDGTVISSASQTWNTLSYGSGTATRKFPYIQASTTSHREVTGTHKGTVILTSSTNVASIDSTSGLITDVTVTTNEAATGINAGAIKTRRVWHSSVLNDTTNWCLGLPEVTSETNSHSLTYGAPVTRTADASWDALYCRPTQQRLEPGDGQWQVTVIPGYDGFGNVSSESVTGVGMTTRTTAANWGTRGQFPVSVTNALNQTTTFAWNYGLGVLGSTTDANALTAQFGYDSFGRLTSESTPDQTSTSITRSAPGGGVDSRVRLVATIQPRDANGVVIRTDAQHFDQYDRLVYAFRTMASGAVSVTERNEWDARGRLTRQYVPYWSGSSHAGYNQLSYDLADRVTGAGLYDASGVLDRSISNTYNGLATTLTDPRGNPTTRTFTAWGDLVRVTDPLSGSTNYGYDAFGLIKHVTDAYSNVVSQVNYNVRGMRTQITDMNMGTWNFTPNALGEIASQTDAKSQTITNTYDLLGRLTNRDAPGASDDVTWQWGNSSSAKNIGSLELATRGAYSETLGYDQYGRLSSRAINVDSASHSYAYAYNNLGVLHTLTWPTSTSGVRFKVKYAYNAGHMVAVRQFTGDVDGTLYWQELAGDAGGHAVDESLGNGLRVISGFNPITGHIEYRQSGTGGATANVQNLVYEWDDAGNLSRREDLLQGQQELFQYDALNRLDTSTLNGVTNFDVSLDLLGNITSLSGVGNYTYHATKKNAVTGAGATAYTYDANGNMISRGGSTIGWTGDNLPANIASGSLSSIFTYGPDGGRVKQTATYSGGNTETTLYLGGMLERRARGTTTEWRHLIPTPAGFVQHVRRSNGTFETYYVAADHLGSTDAILNSAGGIVLRESFAAYGARRGSTWTGTPSSGDMTGVENTTRHGFTHHEHLDNVGLIHMNGRVYDPNIGRFISADPFVQAPFFSQSLNRYSYALNNPLRYTDPSGFNWDDPDHICSWCWPWPPPYIPNPNPYPPPPTPGLPPPDDNGCKSWNFNCGLPPQPPRPGPVTPPVMPPVNPPTTPVPPVIAPPVPRGPPPPPDQVLGPATPELVKTVSGPVLVAVALPVSGRAAARNPYVLGGAVVIGGSLYAVMNYSQTAGSLRRPDYMGGPQYVPPAGSLNVGGATTPGDPNQFDPNRKPDKLSDGPQFDDLRDHAARHSNLSPNAYYNQAVRHTQTGQRTGFYHNGQFKYAYVTRTGVNSFRFTSGNTSGTRIFTHIDGVSTQYLRNIGITLPKGF